jgi:iron(III) transport system substrate-binding protein
MEGIRMNRVSLFLVAFSLLLISAQAAGAQQNLLEKAEKEGKVLLYSGPNMDDTRKLLAGFRKAHPTIETEFYRSGSLQLYNRILTEARAGRFPDVVLISGFQIHLLKKEGFLAVHRPPDAEKYTGGRIDSDGRWIGYFLNTHVISYNTGQVSHTEAPKSYWDLTHPKWKGKLALDTDDVEWFTNQLLIRGEEKGLELMRKLAAQDISFRRGRTLIVQLLAAGEFAVAINSYAYRAQRMHEQGAPVEWVPVQPVVANMIAFGVMEKAPHPNAARLFVNYATSEDGQRLVSETLGRVPARPDVPPNPPRLTQGLEIKVSAPELAEKVNFYTDLFRTTFKVR